VTVIDALARETSGEMSEGRELIGETAARARRRAADITPRSVR
jgi:hypothetical protein